MIPLYQEQTSECFLGNQGKGQSYFLILIGSWLFSIWNNLQTKEIFWSTKFCSTYPIKFNINSVQLLSCVWLFETPWTAARQASLSITNSRSLLKFMSIESVMPSNHLILCRHLLLLPSIFSSIRVFSRSQFLQSGGQSTGHSASASVFPVNIQDWFPLQWTGWISLQSKRLSTVFSNSTVWKHQFFCTQPS